MAGSGAVAGVLEEWWTRLPVNCQITHKHRAREGACLPHSCAACGSTHEPITGDGGAVYFDNGRWLCPDCNAEAS